MSSFTSVTKNIQLGEDLYELIVQKNGMEFTPGQHIHLGMAEDSHMREYSIYSSPDESDLKVLFKSIQDGEVSPKLAKAKPGDRLQIQGPFGNFLLPDGNKNILCIATGTGIAPFRSYIGATSEHSFTLFHGVPSREEGYDYSFLPGTMNVNICSSRDQSGDFHGRVTDLIRSIESPSWDLYCLCGNSDMIYEVIQILMNKGVDRSALQAEIYF
jgi:ferredoxin--NADP+ reductase